MILRDEDANTIGPESQEGLLHERLIDTKIENGNIATTAGGMFIKQADSDYFRFEITFRCTKTQYTTINTIAMNKTSRKFYTPRRILKGESAIREVEIIFEEPPIISEGKTYNNNIIEVFAVMSEVII